MGRPNGRILIAEGFATGATLHEITGHAVACAFSAGNLKPVAEALKRKYPDTVLVICADDDHATDGNPGISKATEAAQAVEGLLAVPGFPETRKQPKRPPTTTTSKRRSKAAEARRLKRRGKNWRH